MLYSQGHSRLLALVKINIIPNWFMPKLGNSTNFGIVHVQGHGIGVTAENQMLTSQLQGEKHTKNKWFPQNTSLDNQQRINYTALPNVLVHYQ